MKKDKNLSRRTFVRTTAAAATAFTILPRHVLGGNGFMAPSDMVNIAGVGIGGRGASDLRGICTPEVVVPSNYGRIYLLIT